MSKRALVVDDSQLARVTLRKLLEQRQLDVDTAESAEDALDYLRHNAPPRVIFLDHMMPGMDGFQTITELKKNPDTAAIPVVMYTSREGQAYMGQARALGAVDVLAKPINRAELDRILSQLELGREEIPVHGLAAVAGMNPPERPATGTAHAPEALEVLAQRAATFHADGLNSAMKALLEEHRLGLRQDLLAHSDVLAERIAARLRDNLDSGDATAAAPGASLRRPMLLLATFAVAIATIALIYGAWTARTPATAQTQEPPTVATVAPPANADEDLAAENERLREQLARRQGDRDKDSERAHIVHTLEWAANLNGQVEYDKPLLGDEQVVLLSEILSRLSAVNFRGTVRLHTHVGEYCTIRTPFGIARLPGDDQPFDSCQIIGMNPEQAVAWGARQSLGFARFLAASPLANNPSVSIELKSHGKDNPLQRYPLPGAAQTAGDWNRIARANNRVEIAIISSP